MGEKIKILHLEDMASDADLVDRELRKSGIPFEKIVVSNKRDFENALENFVPDIVLSDHSLPTFDSIRALKILESGNYNIPFILITATMTEEFAVDMMKNGAADYILKDRLQRLPGALLNALEKWSTVQEKNSAIAKFKEAHDRLKEAQAIAHMGNWQIELSDGSSIWSDESFKIFGIEPGSITPSLEAFVSFIHPEDQAFAKKQMEDSYYALKNLSFEFRFIKQDGSVRHGYAESKLEKDNTGKPIRFFGIIQDITDRKLIEEERERMIADMIQRNRDLEQFAYIISHNLRAPTANIIGLTENLQDKSLTNDEREVFLENLSMTVSRLDDIIKDINDILQVRRDANDKKEIICFSCLIDDISISIGHLIEKYQVKLHQDFSAVDEIYSIKGYMHSIFYNLISNSIKYCKPDVNPEIEIKSMVSDQKIQIVFKDNGLGIDLKSKGDKVFGLYKRFHTHVEGKGMGLFMVKTQVQSLGGKISISSEPGEGTEFILEFNK